MTEKSVAKELQTILEDFANVKAPEADGIFVIGCSTSEVVGSKIGKGSSPQVASELFPVFLSFAKNHNLNLAFQCCEHLNRALVVEKSLAKEKGWTIIHAIPQAKAGGSMATEAYHQFKEACLVETIQANYGIDIGFTMIGMHMEAVVVPLRLDHYKLGETMVNAAFSRPKLIGGARAVYDMAHDEK